MSFTPGPFEICTDDFDNSRYLRRLGAEHGDGFVVERIVAKGIDSPHDASLFATAPELLEALEALVIRSECFGMGESTDEYCAAKAVIAKARGEGV